MLDLAPSHQKLLLDIFHQYAPAGRLFVFGSRVQACAKPHSDIDVLLDLPQGLSLMQRARLRMALEGSDLPMRVDWLLLQDAPDFIARQIHNGQAIALH